MNFLFWFILVFLVVILIYFGVGTYAAVTMTKVGEHPQYDQDPGTFGLDFETVHFPSRRDKLRLAAWFVPNEDTDRSIILVHGRNASKQNAISGKLPELAAELHCAGFNVLMMDLRGHGESEGKRYTWGVYEQWDVLGAVDYLLDEGFLPGRIAVLGISLGGSAVIGAAAKETAVGALAVESTFADLIDLVAPNWTKESGLPMLFLPGVFLMWKILYGINPQDVKPVEDIVQVKPRPVLILHSETDEMIPVSHAQRLAAAVPHAKLVLFDNCSHAELFRDCSKLYLDAVLTFFKDTWGK
ncbi:MAG: alpha/beta fold hydrolase [Chloroflexota bacterium]|nr:alpha/beta fold hydrolase [Chloroflexota bacterium]